MIERAAAEGWRLGTVINNGTAHPYLMIQANAKPFANDIHAGTYVVGQARNGSAFHRHALQCIAASHIKTPKKGKK